ncbi:Manganese/iron superoxide dismutase [Yarrowia lipolytica]|jgi:Fe-Mn family superoxide dismutase|uniref:Manganese/iron superoxide dismutase n=1 Tax=Yarrowia lipolytica TaxID=4952 RepID=A0A371C3M0_YARLL|nr:37S ribosomal protein MRP1 [Yarrowia lipolytica]RDW24915.1 Manganese/iron superoxide dismutase [Yarrowia lipolytica]RDW29418.1 Manganese/iron superoxide dismutase [Yarrowia lipolytica]RDW36587.1 Manganese/iron superoxide dismutase [Yarrowia lipolytica]RDW48857.1 Manganese/iron superoxide dismutase [Yarrowia lipolytica]
MLSLRRALLVPRLGRALHTMPAYSGLGSQAAPTQINKFLSAETVKSAWFEHQHEMLERVNEGLASSEELEGLDLQSLALETCNRSEDALHHFASGAFANDFFFKGVASTVKPGEVSEPIDAYHGLYVSPRDPDYQTVMPALATGETPAWGNHPGTDDALYDLILTSFGTVEAFREHLLTKAESIFGNGYTWLVLSKHSGRLHLVNTYNNGFIQKKGPNSAELAAEAAAKRAVEADEAKALAELQAEAQNKKLNALEEKLLKNKIYKMEVAKQMRQAQPKILHDLKPLLNVNVWQHMWLNDYGAFGKRKYLDNFWEKIDWNVVKGRLQDHFEKQTDLSKSELFGPYV